MTKALKATLITLAALLGLLLVGIALVPFLFKDQIIERLRSELNERLDATVTFSDVDVSFFSTFPTLTAEVMDLAITGKGDFAETKLLAANSIATGIDVVALVMDRSIEISSIDVSQPEVHVLVREDGKANYDILAERSDQPSQALNFEIKRYTISKGLITYDVPGAHISVVGLEHDGRAKISGWSQELSSETTVDALTANVGGITYLKKAKVSLGLDATLETEKEHLTVRALRAAVNHLALEGSGEVGWAGEGTELDLLLASKKGLPINALISAIPNAYAADFAGLKASGEFSLEAKARGQLGPGDDDVPSFSMTAEVRDGAFKYPDLPLGITDLNLDAKVTHPGGNLDKMRIDVPKYGITAGKSRAKGRLVISRPLSQPDIDLELDGQFDLAEIAKAYPIPEVEALEGRIAANIDLRAKGEKIEKLNGNVTITDLLYRPAASGAARQRCHAERAAVIAAILDLDKGPCAQSGSRHRLAGNRFQVKDLRGYPQQVYHEAVLLQVGDNPRHRGKISRGLLVQ